MILECAKCLHRDIISKKGKKIQRLPFYFEMCDNVFD